MLIPISSSRAPALHTPPQAECVAPISADNAPLWHTIYAAKYSEFFAYDGDGAAAALAIGLAQYSALPQGCDKDANGSGRRHAILWVQDKAAIREGGYPYMPGLPNALAAQVIHVAADTTQDALFAMEEGLRCRDIGWVIGEIHGNPQAFNFTTSRRLGFAAKKFATCLWLIRHNAAPDLSCAPMRLRVRSTHSLPNIYNTKAPGAPRWHGEVFRAQGVYGHDVGDWIMGDDGQKLTAAPRGSETPSFGAPDGLSDSSTPDYGDLAVRYGARSVAAGASR